MSSDDHDTEIKFSTDIEERSCRFGVVNRSKKFHALSNFQISILSEVQASEYSGFTCRVTFYTGEVLGLATTYLTIMYAHVHPHAAVMLTILKSKRPAGGKNGCRH